jgi:hypothetical protein
MNRTPRLLNRILLAILGLALLACGAHLSLAAVAPDYAAGWRQAAAQLDARANEVLAATTLPGQSESWLWILIAGLLICLILLVLWWIAVQGSGRGGDYVSAYFDDEPLPGRVEISQHAVEQALRHVLGRRNDIISIGVSVWGLEPEAGLRIKVQPRKGTAPGPLGREVARAAQLVQQTMGTAGPVVVYLAVGTRSRFARVERVL